jgi:hypothetical protein
MDFLTNALASKTYADFVETGGVLRWTHVLTADSRGKLTKNLWMKTSCGIEWSLTKTVAKKKGGRSGRP